MTTITINKRTRAGKTIFDLAQALAVKNKSVVINDNELEIKSSIITKNETLFLKKIKRSGQHAREIGAGIRKGNSIKVLMDEL